MGITPKWWFGLLILWLFVAVVCYAGSTGTFVMSNQDIGVQINDVITPDHPDITYGFDIVKFMYNSFTWDYAFFETTIGSWIKPLLIMLSLSLFIPIIEAAVRLFKPFS